MDMETKESIKESITEEIYGMGGFPALTILLAFIMTMLGWAIGNTFAAVTGLLVLLFTVIRLEYIAFGPVVHGSYRHVASPDSETMPA